MKPASTLPLPELAAAVVRTARTRDGDWRAALYLLTRGCRFAFLRDRRIWDHVQVDDRVDEYDRGEVEVVALDFDAMLAEPGWTGAERLLIRAAACLFTDGDTVVGIHEFDWLDVDNRTLVVDAMRDRWDGRNWSAGTESLLYDYASGPVEVRR